MIFAMNNEDPSCTDFNWKYHDQNKWTKSMLLLSYKEDNIDQQGILPADTFTIDFRMRNVVL